MITRARAWLLLIFAFVLMSSSCGNGGVDETGEATGALALAPTITAQSTTTIPPTTTEAPDPHLVWVAMAKERVKVLETFDVPRGERVYHEFAVTNPTYFDTPLALMVTKGDDDSKWLKVQLPVRPNGTQAWIRARDVVLFAHRFRAEVNVTTREVSVFNAGELIAHTPAVVGKEETPTPLGRFYVNILLPKDNPYGAYGPWILGLSGFSEVLDSFDGGLPAIAIHGTNHPELVGQQASNGCVRVPNEAISLLAETVPLGTPVDIVA